MRTLGVALVGACCLAVVPALAAEEYELVQEWPSVSPKSIAVDAAGNIYLTGGSYRRRIYKFSGDGALMKVWGGPGSGPGELGGGSALAVGPAGDVYVADGGNNRIQRFTDDGTYVDQWGSPGSGDGEFDSPVEVAVGPDGSVYVADWGNHRIQRFTGDGTYVSQWGYKPWRGGGYDDGPADLAVDASGNVYVVDRGNDRIEKFASDGTYVKKWGGSGSGEGEFSYPSGVAVDSAANVYVVDSGNNSAQKFRPNGEYITQWTTNSGSLWASDVTVDSRGDVFFGRWNPGNVFGGQIVKYRLRPPTFTQVIKWWDDTANGVLGDNVGENRFLRGAQVELWDDDGIIGDDLLGTGTLDDSGTCVFESIQCDDPDGADLYAKIPLVCPEVSITNWTAANLKTAVIKDVTEDRTSVDRMDRGRQSTFAYVFTTLRSLHEDWDKLTGYNTPQVHVSLRPEWLPPNKAGYDPEPLPFREYTQIRLGYRESDIGASRAWNRFTIAHEYGHHIMYKAYGDRWPPGAKGADHHVMFETDPAFALTEGWAAFVQNVLFDDALANPLNLTSLWLVPAEWGQWHSNSDIESNHWWMGTDIALEGGEYVNPNGNTGEIVEGAVASVLWDVFDSDDSDEPEGGIGKGLNKIWQVMSTDHPGNLMEFANAFVERYPTTNTRLTAIMARHGVREDEYELDDNLASAQPISVGEVQERNNYSTFHQNDWARFTAKAGNTYVIETFDLGPTANTSLWLYPEPAQSVLPLKKDTNGGEACIVWTCQTSGTYYIKERPDETTAVGDGATYKLWVSAEDDFEVDDTPGEARRLRIGQAQRRNHASLRHQNDWAQFPATKGQRYEIKTFRLGSKASTMLFLYGDPEAAPLKRDRDGGEGSIVWTCPTSGTYYVRVRPKDASAIGWATGYNLMVTQDTASDPGPDTLVSDGGAWVGDNIYNQTGQGQSVAQDARPGERVAYRVQVQNGSDELDKLRIVGPASDGTWTLAYQRYNGKDITDKVTTDGWYYDLPPGESLRFKVKVTPRASTASGTVSNIAIQAGRAAHNAAEFEANADVGRLVTTVVSGTSGDAGQITSLCVVPTSAGAQLTFTLSSAASVSARILNLAGRPVKTLCTARACEAGANTLLWNATSDQGLTAPNGTYLVEVMARAEEGDETRGVARVELRR